MAKGKTAAAEGNWQSAKGIIRATEEGKCIAKGTLQIANCKTCTAEAKNRAAED